MGNEVVLASILCVMSLMISIFAVFSPSNYMIYGKLETDLYANRPVAGRNERWFFATDTEQLFYDNGTGWTEVELAGGEGGGMEQHSNEWHDPDFAFLVHWHNDTYSLLGHNHDAAYSAIDHDHDTVYALIDHNHDGTYSLVAHTHALNDLSDVSISSPSEDQFLRYSSGTWVNEAVTIPSDLNDLDDVTITSPSDGESLVYDSGTGDWVNEMVSGGTSLTYVTDKLVYDTSTSSTTFTQIGLVESLDIDIPSNGTYWVHSSVTAYVGDPGDADAYAFFRLYDTTNTLELVSTSMGNSWNGGSNKWYGCTHTMNYVGTFVEDDNIEVQWHTNEATETVVCSVEQPEYHAFIFALKLG